MRGIKALILAAAARVTATTTSAAKDVSGYSGEVLLILNASDNEVAPGTSDIKLQHCDTVGGAYVDAGVAFAQVTNAAGSGQQSLSINVDKLKKFVKVVNTMAGAGTALAYGVTLVGKKDRV